MNWACNCIPDGALIIIHTAALNTQLDFLQLFLEDRLTAYVLVPS